MSLQPGRQLSMAPIDNCLPYWPAKGLLFAGSQRMPMHVASFDSLSDVLAYCFHDTKIIESKLSFF